MIAVVKKKRKKTELDRACKGGTSTISAAINGELYISSDRAAFKRRTSLVIVDFFFFFFFFSPANKCFFSFFNLMHPLEKLGDINLISAPTQLSNG